VCRRARNVHVTKRYAKRHKLSEQRVHLTRASLSIDQRPSESAYRVAFKNFTRITDLSSRTARPSHFVPLPARSIISVVYCEPRENYPDNVLGHGSFVSGVYATTLSFKRCLYHTVESFTFLYKII